MTNTSCGAVVKGGSCSCSIYAESVTRQDFYRVCAKCGHTSDIHGGHKERKSAPETVSVPVIANIPARPSAGTVEAVRPNGDPSPKQMRAWLIANNVSGVGQRGRLKPEHIQMALSNM